MWMCVFVSAIYEYVYMYNTYICMCVYVCVCMCVQSLQRHVLANCLHFMPHALELATCLDGFYHPMCLAIHATCLGTCYMPK